MNDSLKGIGKSVNRVMTALGKKTVEVPGIRIGGRQTIVTLIDEEMLLLAKFLRTERQTWISRIVNLS